MDNGLYILKHDPRIKAVTVVPSEFFESFPAKDQVTALKHRIKMLVDDLQQIEEVFTNHKANDSEAVLKSLALMLELELAQQYLVVCRERCRFPWSLDTANRSQPAA